MIEEIGSPGKTRTCNPSVNRCGAQFYDTVRWFAIALILRASSGDSRARKSATACDCFLPGWGTKWGTVSVRERSATMVPAQLEERINRLEKANRRLRALALGATVLAGVSSLLALSAGLHAQARASGKTVAAEGI